MRKIYGDAKRSHRRLLPHRGRRQLLFGSIQRHLHQRLRRQSPARDRQSGKKQSERRECAIRSICGPRRALSHKIKPGISRSIGLSLATFSIFHRQHHRLQSLQPGDVLAFLRSQRHAHQTQDNSRARANPGTGALQQQQSQGQGKDAQKTQRKPK